MRTASFCALFVGLLAGSMAFQPTVRAEQGKGVRPEVEQMIQTISEKLQSVADKLGLTEDQKKQVSEINAKNIEQYKNLRAERKELIQNEMKALGTILTEQQREKVKAFMEDKAEKLEKAKAGLPNFSGSHWSLAERLMAASRDLDLSSDQRKQIIRALGEFAGKYVTLQSRFQDIAEDEFRSLANLLTPEQKDKARAMIENRVVRAAAAMSIADRLGPIAEKLGLTREQRQQIVKTHADFASKYHQLKAERRELLQEELQAMGAILTPEQREKVQNFLEDRVVVLQVDSTDARPEDLMKALKETIKDRLEVVADKLGLTEEQRTKIKDAHGAFAEKFKAQREQRMSLRQEELKALGDVLTPEQREKVKKYIEDNSENGDR